MVVLQSCLARKSLSGDCSSQLTSYEIFVHHVLSNSPNAGSSHLLENMFPEGRESKLNVCIIFIPCSKGLAVNYNLFKVGYHKLDGIALNLIQFREQCLVSDFYYLFICVVQDY